jgi:haloalkane dehalogenase
MRDFTKSIFSFSWAATLFGVQQTLNLLNPSQAAKAFNHVTEAAVGEFDGWAKTVFRTGDNLQKGLVELTCGLFTGQAFNPKEQMVKPLSAVEPGISPDYSFKPHYVEVFGSRMHYVDEGAGETILFLHGNGTWSYLWRNVIPHLTPIARCVAPDLIGFGKSDKPDIEYSVQDHAKYLEEFIRKLGLTNITLVLNDMGVMLGLNHAMRNENQVKAVAFFEGIVRPFPSWSTFSTPEFRQLIRRFRTGGIGGEGWQLLVDQNIFVEQLLPQSAGRPLTEVEMNFYRAPFKDPRSRKPIWRLAQSAPIEGEPKDIYELVSEYSRRLQQSALPKLLLYATPGAVINQELVDWCRQRISKLNVVHVGPGVHFLQESSPHVLGKELAHWYRSLPSSC